MNFSDDYISMSNKSLLIIPFEPFMYQSEINRELHKENQMEGEEICKNFAEGIDESFRYVFKDKCNVSSFYYLEENKRYQDLSFVFQNRKLEYVQNEAVQENTGKGLKAFLSGKNQNTASEGLIAGEVVSIEDNKRKYMKAVANELLIDSLRRQFKSDFILFINQLDIKNMYGSVYEMANMDYNRKIDLHYTLYNSDGNILSTGISSTVFPATENDIHHIIADYFPVLAKNIYEDLFSNDIN